MKNEKLMIMNNIQNFGEFYVLLKQLPGGGDGLKEDLVYEFTGGRTTSLREMTFKEYRRMCASMREGVGDGMSERGLQTELKKRRSAVLHRMQQLGVDTTDWARVDNFCLQPRIAGKLFRKLTLDELSDLIPKLENMKRKKKQQDPVIPKELLEIPIGMN